MRRRLLTWILAFTTALAAQAGEQQVVHMLVRAFTVQELPVRLPISIISASHLMAVCFAWRMMEGFIVLRDTDGDGLEDSEQLFGIRTTLTVPVGMVLRPKEFMFPRTAKCRSSVILMATAKRTWKLLWPLIGRRRMSLRRRRCHWRHSANPQGNLYFGLIAADYSNPYRVKDGISHYELNGKRGTIQKNSHAAKNDRDHRHGNSRPYALAFNKAGDLFCTDQEGERGVRTGTLWMN